MASAASLVVSVLGSTTHYTAAMARAAATARSTAGSVSGSMGGAFSSINRSASSTGSHIEGVFGRLKGLAAGLFAALGVASAGEVLKVADQYQQLEIRIRNAAGSSEEFAKVNRELFSIAQRNGAAFDATGQTFINLKKAAQEFGATNDEVLKVTNAVQQLGVISGSSGEAMNTALTQFGQALASGTLQGDELKSIMENMPELADRLAKGLGVARGELKKLGADGKLLSADVFNALAKQAEEIQKDFEKMPISMERGINMAKNSAEGLIGELDSTFGITKLIAGAIKDWSSNTDEAIQMLKAWGNESVRVLDQVAKRSSVIKAGLMAWTQDPVTMATAAAGLPGMQALADQRIKDALAQVQAQEKALDDQRQKSSEHQKKRDEAAEKSAAKAAKLAERQTNHVNDYIRGLVRANQELFMQLTGQQQQLDLFKALEDAKEKAGRSLTGGETAKITEQIDAKKQMEEFQRDLSMFAAEVGSHIDKQNGSLQAQHELNESLTDDTQKLIQSEYELDQARIESSARMVIQMERQVKYQELVNAGKEKEAEWLQINDQLADQLNSKTSELTDRARAAFDKNQEQIAQAKQQADLTQQAQDALSSHLERNTNLAGSLSSALGNAFENAIFSGQNFGSVLRGLAVDLEKLILKITVLDPLTKAITGAFTGGAGSGILGAITNLFNKKSGPQPLQTINGTLPVVPGFAAGGDIAAGQVAVVGENGPELIKPRSGSTVVPNGRAAIQPEVNVIINNNTDATAKVEQRTNSSGGIDQIVTIVKEEITQDIRRNGKVGRAIESTFGARRSTIAR